MGTVDLCAVSIKNSGESVELCSELALLSCSVILVKNTLSDSLVNLLDSGLIGFACESLITCCESCIILLDGGLHGRLEHLILQSLCFDNENALLCGLNIRQNDSPPSQNGGSQSFHGNRVKIVTAGGHSEPVYLPTYCITSSCKFQELFQNYFEFF